MTIREAKDAKYVVCAGLNVSSQLGRILYMTKLAIHRAAQMSSMTSILQREGNPSFRKPSLRAPAFQLLDTHVVC